MLDHITPIDQLEQEALRFQSFLEITVSESGAENVNRGNDLSVIIARTGKMLSDAQYHMDAKLGNELVIQLVAAVKAIPKITPTAINAIVDSSCKREKHLVKWIERMNRAATHQQDFCRTVISKAKADQFASRNMNG